MAEAARKPSWLETPTCAGAHEYICSQLAIPSSSVGAGGCKLPRSNLHFFKKFRDPWLYIWASYFSVTYLVFKLVFRVLAHFFPNVVSVANRLSAADSCVSSCRRYASSIYQDRTGVPQRAQSHLDVCVSHYRCSVPLDNWIECAEPLFRRKMRLPFNVVRKRPRLRKALFRHIVRGDVALCCCGRCVAGANFLRR